MIKTRLTAIFALVSLILGTFVMLPAPALAVPQSPQVGRVAKVIHKVKSEKAVAPGGYWVVATKHPSALSTLSKISSRAYGSAGKWQRICDANKLSNCNLIQIGQRLYVPTLTEPVTAARPERASRTNSASGWIHPLANGRLGGSCFGWRSSTGSFHYGIDIGSPSGTPVRAVHAGTVVVNKWSSSAGNYVAVNHGTYQTVYMHFRSRSPVGVGTKVNAGTTIGYVGDTGNPKPGDYHLHFEVHQGLWNNKLNPAAFMRSVGVNIGC